MKLIGLVLSLLIVGSWIVPVVTFAALAMDFVMTIMPSQASILLGNHLISELPLDFRTLTVP